MACKTCGQSSSHSLNSSSCCDLNAMNVDGPLDEIRNGDDDFCFNEITNKICENLQNDEGINPSATHSNTDCDDLTALNDLATGSLHNALMTLNMCDVDAYKCWLDNLLSWQWNVDKGIICAICGLWTNVHNLWDKIDNLQDKINQIQQSVTVNGKIEVPREVPVDDMLANEVNLGDVTDDLNVEFIWHMGSTRGREKYRVGDLRTNNCHIMGTNMDDRNGITYFCELFTKIKSGTNNLWATTFNEMYLNVNGSIPHTHHSYPTDEDGNRIGEPWYDTQEPNYGDEGYRPAVRIDKVIVYDLVDPIIVE